MRDDIEQRFLEQRRRAVVESDTLYGLDRVEARLLHGTEDGERWELRIHFLDKGERGSVPTDLAPENLHLDLGGMADPTLRLRRLELDGDRTCLRALVDRENLLYGTEDSRLYTLRIRGVAAIDSFFSSAPIRLERSKETARSGLLFEAEAGKETPPPPPLDFLAKEFDDFRRLMLERMGLEIPDWVERHPADIGVTIVELLAYAADGLSYYQDAVANETYLSTARQRVSVRRHARLLSYRLHEGCNARCFVHFHLGKGVESPYYLADASPLLSHVPLLDRVILHPSPECDRALGSRSVVFQTTESAVLHTAHNVLEIYTWGADHYVLRAGANRATLKGHLEHLEPGQVLLIERSREVGGLGKDEVDSRARQVVRLSGKAPAHGYDALRDQPITEIEWLADDALRRDYPVARTVDGTPHLRLSQMRGNLVLADHGMHQEEILGPWEGDALRLDAADLTFHQIYDPDVARTMPATALLAQVPYEALPDLHLQELDEAGRPGPWWLPQQDLLHSGSVSRDFVVEMTEEGVAMLRFGDGVNGRLPRFGTLFRAVYRLGNGPDGNLGAHALRHLVLPRRVPPDPTSTEFKRRVEERLRRKREGLPRLVESDVAPDIRVENPLPAEGGQRRERIEDARLAAPYVPSSKISRRHAVARDDFAEIAERRGPDVFRAAASRAWGGDGPSVRLHVQRASGFPIDEAFRQRLNEHMAPWLLAGHRIEIVEPRYVPLDIHLEVEIDRRIPRESFLEAINGPGADAAARRFRRLFHPKRFTFGKTVFLSEIVSIVADLDNVLNVRTKHFKRWGEPARGEIESGEIRIDSLEVARLENNPASPNHGLLRLDLVAAQA